MTDAINTGNYTAIDTETTGLNCYNNEIIEIGAVRFRQWVPVKEFDVLIHPKCRIPSFITELTGIDNYMVEDQPPIEDVIEDFMSFLGEDDIVGHNLTFDLNFLSAQGVPMYTSGFEFFDTMKIGRRVLKKGVEIQNHRLCTLCEYYGIHIANAHRAADDARATGMLFKKLNKNNAVQ